MSTGALLPDSAEVRDQRQPIAPGKHAIDDERVVASPARHFEAGFAVMRLVGDMPGLAERLHEIARRLSVVFDDQDSHGVR